MKDWYRDIIRVIFFLFLLLSLIYIPFINQGLIIIMGSIYILIDEIFLRKIFHKKNNYNKGSEK
ncbi:hypothetical protein FH115_11020 [Staphylococcus hominis]|uniref:hypothetical protein n=1 Tax=Staphylococcus hominis TaxID=1290 RepID=UPI001F55D0B9|nr:hypothetical protein [Staphylococcus hominis]MCI2870189.1 hypothetical protein [Staphylococcus hominis]MDS3894747.1 hypothetical protein [Staphylococcus hominis]